MSVPTPNRHFRELTTISVGYESPSQFSREYRRMFGLPPGEDARRLQDARAEA